MPPVVAALKRAAGLVIASASFGTGMAAMAITFETLHPAIGAAVQGVDLAMLADDAFAALRDGLGTHGLLLLRGYDITDAQQIELSRRFGEPERFPLAANTASGSPLIFRATNVAEDGTLLPVDDANAKYLSLTQIWHTDSSYRPVPTHATLLRALEVPPCGGDTMFCSLAAAWDALPAERRARIEGLRAVHSFEYTRGLTRGLTPLTEAERARVPPVTHPLVRRHPAGDGRRSLYISPHTMPGIVGLDDAEGRALIGELTEWATQPRFVYRHRWQPGDLLIWDNRVTMHAVTPYDSGRERRIMHRTCVAGTEPVA